MWWQDFFYFTKRERQGIILLLVLLGGIFLGKYVFVSKPPQPLVESEDIPDSVSIKKVFVKHENDYTVTELNVKREFKQRQNDIPERKRTYYVHGKDTLVRPYKETYLKTEKFPEGTVIELNESDTTDLKKIPGIGSGYARRIVNYRNVLGGFFRKEQLQEVYGMYEELYDQILPYVEVDPGKIAQIDVNTSSLDKLKAHPYINFYQAKAIIEQRKRKKIIYSISELSLLGEFTEEDRFRLFHYLCFD